MPGVASGGDRERDVVVDAEARRPRAHRVVEAAGRREGVVGLARAGSPGPRRSTRRPPAPTPRASRGTPGRRRCRCPSPAAARGGRSTSGPARCSRGSWSRASSSSLASRAAMSRSAPTERTRPIPGPKRRGVSGCPGPKSYSRSASSQTRIGSVDRARRGRAGRTLGPAPSAIARLPRPDRDGLRERGLGRRAAGDPHRALGHEGLERRRGCVRPRPRPGPGRAGRSHPRTRRSPPRPTRRPR